MDFNYYGMTSACSRADISADMDAIIITKNFINDGFDISESIENYYELIHSNTIRKNLFRSYLVEKYASQINTNNLEIKLKVSIYHFIGVGIIFYGPGYDYYELVDHCNIIDPLFKFLREEGHYPLMEARVTIANMFVNYLIN